MLKKNQLIQGKISDLLYPSLGVMRLEGAEILIKGALPGQEVEIRLSKNHRLKKEGKLLSVLERADYEEASFCEHFGSCGGCARQTVPYQDQLALKRGAVNALFRGAGLDYAFEEILSSPEIYQYRNKMEYSFGNETKGGIVNLGMHKKGKFYDVVSIPLCHLIDGDFRAIVTCIEALARQEAWAHFNRNTGEGTLRHVVVRKGFHTGEVLVGISTTSGFIEADEAVLVAALKALPLEGKLVGVMRLVNDDLGDAVKASSRDRLLYGKPSYTEKLMGLTFEVSFFSFFQTNTQGAQRLYEEALSKLSDLEGKVLYDLFSGTGTIGQIAAARARQVIGIEIVAEAVEAANLNASFNGLDNCTFLAGDVFAILDQMATMPEAEKPDVIVVDPPRAGMMPKTVDKIAAFGVSEILYISCNPKTMVDNLLQFEEKGYQIKEGSLVDLYPHTDHVETVVLLSRAEK